MSRETWILIAVVVGVIGLITLWGAIRLARKLLVTRRMLGELGAGGKWAFYGALIYTVLPIDLLPDPIYLDDMGVLALAVYFLNRMVRQRRASRPASPEPTPARRR